MEYTDLDKEEIERRKKDQIAWQNVKKTTNLFTFVMTVIEIAVTLAVILVMFLLAAKIIFTVGDSNSETTQKIFLGAMLVIFFLGLFIGFILFRLIARWSIKHFKLETKLTDEVLNHYTKQPKDKKETKVKK